MRLEEAVAHSLGQRRTGEIPYSILGDHLALMELWRWWSVVTDSITQDGRSALRRYEVRL